MEEKYTGNSKAMKLRKYLTFISIGIFISCQTKTEWNEIVTDNNMAATINIGSRVVYTKPGEIKKSDIIIFKSPLTGKISCLRVVGLPGDNVEVVNGILYINKKEYKLPKSSKMIYTVYSKNTSAFSILKSKYEFKPYSENYGMVGITKNQFNEIIKDKIVDSIYQLGFDSNYVYPQILKVSTSKRFNHFYFGPITVPKVGSKIYRKDKMLISSFINFDNDTFEVVEPFYFCIGDSFADAMDSRVIGLLPQSRIIGTVVAINSAKEITEKAN